MLSKLNYSPLKNVRVAKLIFIAPNTFAKGRWLLAVYNAHYMEVKTGKPKKWNEKWNQKLLR